MGSSSSKQPANGAAAGPKQAPPKITAKDRAILDLKVQRDKLRQYQKQLEAVQARETELAKEFLAKGDKRRALLALKKKKYQDTLLEKTDNQMLVLEQLTSSIEFALVEKQVVEGLKTGSAVLKELNNEMKIEDVERLMDDTADAIAYQQEVSDLLSSKITAEDEEEIERELDMLVAEEEREAASGQLDKLPEVPTAPLPDVGDKVPTPAKAKEKSRKKEDLVAA
ncbi:Snf7-domain-containing protein [Hyaloraphidium curvatum]|nr:Snf7-domain-containing protein [Hyaloraphidium curvatum]